MNEIKELVEKLREIAPRLNGDTYSGDLYARAVGLALSILHLAGQSSSPLAERLKKLGLGHDGITGYCEALFDMYDHGALVDLRLKISAAVEDDFLDVAEGQLRESKKATGQLKEMRLAIAAFLIGAVLEESLRRQCDKHGIAYDPAKTTNSSLAALLYVPSQNIEHISKSDQKQITVWGDLRNTADHGHFDKLSVEEVSAAITGVRGFINRHST